MYSESSEPNVYTMGSADVRAYSRNKRGIAGSLIWINFDRHALLNVFRKARGKFVADKDEIRPQYQDSTIDGSAIFTSSVTRDLGPQAGIGSTISGCRPGLSLAADHNPSRTRATGPAPGPGQPIDGQAPAPWQGRGVPVLPSGSAGFTVASAAPGATRHATPSPGVASSPLLPRLGSPSAASCSHRFGPS